MLRIFKTKSFAKWAKKERVSDASLLAIIAEINQGLVDAELGAGLIKKRIASQNRGKRAGHRALIAFKESDRALYLFGFSKGDRENITADELFLYKELSRFYLQATPAMLAGLLEAHELYEVCDAKNKKN